MHIRAGFEIAYDCPQPTPMVLMLTVHPSFPARDFKQFVEAARKAKDGVNYNSQVAASDIFYERFLDPADTNFIGKDTKVYQYNFQIATNQAFNQTNNAIYWLSVTASGTTKTQTSTVRSSFFAWRSIGSMKSLVVAATAS